jgi:ankyrin repeat protein
MGKICSITGINLLVVFVLGATVTSARTTNASETGAQAVLMSLFAESGEHQAANKVFTGETLGDTFGSYLDAGKDVDGDGHNDLLIGAPRHGSRKGRAYLFYGGPNMDTKPDKVFSGEEVGDLFGVGVVLGDINGDRYADVIVGAPGYNSEQGRVYVFYGGPEMDTIPDKIFNGEKDTSAGFGQWLNVGDLNGDQRPDLTVSARGWDNFRGRVYVFYGSQGADIDTTADMILDGENPGDRFGCKHTLGNDVNGDGYLDLVVGAESWPNDNQQGRAYLYYGGPDMDTAPDVIFTGEAGEPGGQFGYANELSDIDRDGFVDVIIGAPFFNSSRGRAYLFFGGPDMDNVADRIFKPEGSSGQAHLGTAIACGRMNRNGHTDIAFGCPGHSDYTGQACVYHGGPGRSMDQIPDKVFEGEVSRSYFGAPVKLADLNGDYTHDLLVAANTYIPVQGRFQGRVYLYHGEPLPVTKKFIPGLEVKPTKSLFQAAAEGDIKQVRLHISSGTNINERTVSGDTALHYAAREGHKELVELLIANGAEITTVHIAAFLGDLRQVEVFLKKGIDVKDKDTAEYTALHFAARGRQREVIELLIAQGANVNAKDQQGQTALHYAAEAGDMGIVEFLIARDAEVNAKDQHNYTPLHRAAGGGHKDIVKLLLDNGVDVNASARWDYTPIYYAAWSGNTEIVELLVEKGADVNAKDEWDWTPLHYMAQYDYYRDMAEFLIAKGADVNTKDKWGETPLQVAKDKGHAEIVQLLRKHGAKE